MEGFSRRLVVESQLHIFLLVAFPVFPELGVPRHITLGNHYFLCLFTALNSLKMKCMTEQTPSPIYAFTLCKECTIVNPTFIQLIQPIWIKQEIMLFHALV
jgi:hypothetical protein